MDFPVCPACHQSVIDDDAVDCPFCGASMKSKPGSKPAPVAAKPSVTPPKPVGPKPAPSKPTLPGDDFPFDAELTSGKSAIPAMPNPTKQRSWQVVCPMCDTPGYVPASAAGKDIRCSNAKCVMPVFTAPSPKKTEEAPPPPPPKSSNLPFVGGVTVVLMLVVGVGLYVINSLPSNSGMGGKKQMSAEDMQELSSTIGGTKKPVDTKVQPKSNGVVGKKDPVAETTEAVPLPADDLVKNALKQMADSSLEKSNQRSKPFCRQLAAEANAVTGNIAAAREHLHQLLKVGNDVSYYRILPLLDLYWAELAAGDTKGSTSTLNTAMDEVPKIPKFGRTRQEIVGRLAAALVAGDRSKDALALLADFQSSDADAQFAARIQIASDGRVAPLSDAHSVLPWKFPQAVAATASLIVRGQMEAAAAWAGAQSSDDAKAECLGFWAEEFVNRNAVAGSADAGGSVALAVKSLAPVYAARVWARAGVGRSRANDQPGVIAAIKLAQDQLAQVSKPGESKMPTIKLTDRFKLPAAGPLLLAATAAAEIANLQAQSATTKSDAEASLDTAMIFTDAIAPSLAVARQRHDEAQRLGPNGLRKMIKDELKKKTDDEARVATSNYTRALNEIFEASQKRFDVETQLLSRLRGAGVGLDSKVWIIVDSRATADDLNRRDDFFLTGLPGELREGLKGTDEEKAILGAWNLRFQNSEPTRPLMVEFNERLETNVASAIELIRPLDSKSNRLEEMLLQASSRLSATNKVAIAFQLIPKLDDIVVREDCYLMAAALASQRGQAAAVVKQVAQITQHTEKVALCRGLIAGLKVAGKPNSGIPLQVTRP